MATRWIARFCCRPLPRREGQNFSQTMVDVGFIEFRLQGLEFRVVFWLHWTTCLVLSWSDPQHMEFDSCRQLGSCPRGAGASMRVPTITIIVFFCRGMVRGGLGKTLNP